MFTKIIKLENVKQWQHTIKGGAENEFSKLNLIYGRNGAGKSTLTKILDLINKRDVAKIKQLAPLESNKEPFFNFMIKGKNITLTSLDQAPEFYIFNQDFVDENLYSSNGVESSQLVNYYDFCLGKTSVDKQNEIDQLKGEITNLTNLMQPLETKLKQQFNKTIEQIKKIPFKDNIDSEIAKLEEQLSDIKAVNLYRQRKKLSRLAINKPNFDKSIFDVTLEKISQEAQEKVSQHIKDHLKREDEHWIKDGLELVTETNACPFCAQNLSDSSIFSFYSEFITESYKQACDNFELNHYPSFESPAYDIGISIGELKEKILNNEDLIQTWSDRVEKVDLKLDLKQLENADKLFFHEVRDLITKKEKDILVSVNFDKFDNLLRDVYEKADFTEYNERVSLFNQSITEFLATLVTDDSTVISQKIRDLNLVKFRYSQIVVEELKKISQYKLDKDAKTRSMTELREQILEEQQILIDKHKDGINELLKKFNSMIRLSKFEKDNKGHKGASRISYGITFLEIDLSILNHNEMIFDRVLSSGDKSALALAFFLSKFKDENFEPSIIFFDDPMTSLDEHRRKATIQEIQYLVEREFQTFVLSHDPFFLSEISKLSAISKFSKCFEVLSEIKDSNPLDQNSNKVCNSRLISKQNFNSYVLHSYYQEYYKLWDFVQNGQESEKVDIARSIRPILEAYLRFIFPKVFTEDLWLGSMISKIREEKNETSPLFDTNNKLKVIESINDFSKAYHHADGFDTSIQGIEFLTLKHYAKDTLIFITGLN
ncbi:AAA family ATPase [Acinetobacter terrae]|uniref:AAA family ATPase n=1 Tax=Acinetobacter terrae TaxID=2731247 RepID=A0A8E4MFM3_9GAMM|nr:AAA family ATPase [Acinetobacter terrae]NNH39698.1 AAA family ATPase [Acinetobacter terrae]NNH87173.1 AAA family ATPase [Acinetobacter terrae]